MTNYLLDANVFMAASRLHYGLDFCPAFWEWLIENNKKDRVFTRQKGFYFVIHFLSGCHSQAVQPDKGKIYLSSRQGNLSQWL